MADIPISFGGGGGSGSDDVTATNAQVLQGYTAITSEGDDEPTTGTIPIKNAETYYTATSSDRTIPVGTYINQQQTIKAVKAVGLSEGNIKKGVTIKIGDSVNSGRVLEVAGTYTTPSSGQSAVVASAMRSGYSGYVNGGSQIDGSIPTYSGGTSVTPSSVAKTLYTSGTYGGYNITVNGDANLVAANIKSGVSIFGINGTAPQFKGLMGTYSITSATAGITFEYMDVSTLKTDKYPFVLITNHGFVPKAGYAHNPNFSYNSDSTTYYCGNVWMWVTSYGRWKRYNTSSSGWGYFTVNKLSCVLNSTTTLRVPFSSALSSIKCCFFGY